MNELQEKHDLLKKESDEKNEKLGFTEVSTSFTKNIMLLRFWRHATFYPLARSWSRVVYVGMWMESVL